MVVREGSGREGIGFAFTGLCARVFVVLCRAVRSRTSSDVSSPQNCTLSPSTCMRAGRGVQRITREREAGLTPQPRGPRGRLREGRARTPDTRLSSRTSHAFTWCERRRLRTLLAGASCELRASPRGRRKGEEWRTASN
jgi:hypothetical protein